MFKILKTWLVGDFVFPLVKVESQIGKASSRDQKYFCGVFWKLSFDFGLQSIVAKFVFHLWSPCSSKAGKVSQQLFDSLRSASARAPAFACWEGKIVKRPLRIGLFEICKILIFGILLEPRRNKSFEHCIGTPLVLAVSRGNVADCLKKSLRCRFVKVNRL